MGTLPETNLLVEENIEDFEEITEPSYTYNALFETGRIIGNVDGIAAVKQSVYHILHTERFKYLIYSDDYGIELWDLFGEEPDYVETELEDRITEALLEDDRITNVGSFEFKHEKGICHVTFCAETIFGSIDGLELEVEE